MTACRHGGMTELGDAELTEQGVMSLSGHRSPEAARGYVKKTETQRLAAARKRRAQLICCVASARQVMAGKGDKEALRLRYAMRHAELRWSACRALGGVAQPNLNSTPKPPRG